MNQGHKQAPTELLIADTNRYFLNTNETTLRTELPEAARWSQPGNESQTPTVRLLKKQPAARPALFFFGRNRVHERYLR